MLGCSKENPFTANQIEQALNTGQCIINFQLLNLDCISVNYTADDFIIMEVPDYLL